jgi:pyruvate/2-oxoglutarate dehydrogenase complex dihydrolipoamide acyltransferase (E2) component
MSRTASDAVGRFRRLARPSNSSAAAAMMEVGRRRHHVAGLGEIDVTDSRSAIREYRRTSGKGMSLTAWVVKCVSQAVAEQPEVQACRKGRRGLVIFEDVDVLVVVERLVGNERLPLPYIVRRANAKSLQQVHDEIRSAQTQELAGHEVSLGQVPAPWFAPFFRRLPEVLQRIPFGLVARHPFLAKRVQGTVGVTAVGMFGRFAGWPLTVGLHTLDFALGGVVRRPGVVGGKVAIREYLRMTVLVDHDVVDGAPAARFISRLGQLMESGSGLTAQARVQRYESAPGSTV